MRIFSSLPTLSLVIAFNVTIAAILSYFEFVYLAYFFYSVPFLLFFYMFGLVVKSKIKSRKEYKLYLKNEGTIYGTILNRNGKTFNFVSVRLTYLDGSIGPNFANRYYTGTNKSGEYEINHIPYGKFLLNITYKDSTQTFPIEITKEKPKIEFRKIL